MIKSKAHAEKFKELLKSGKITQAQHDEAMAKMPKNLPERVEKGPAKPKSLLKRRHTPV